MMWRAAMCHAAEHCVLISSVSSESGRARGGRPAAAPGGLGTEGAWGGSRRCMGVGGTQWGSVGVLRAGVHTKRCTCIWCTQCVSA